MALAAQPAPPPPPPPALHAPAPYEVSFGRIAGLAPPGTRGIAVRAGGRLVALRRLRGRSFDFHVALPLGDITVSVRAVGAGGRRSRAATVTHVFGLPAAARPRAAQPRLDPELQRRLIRLVRAFPGTAGVYVQDLVTGAGAAWNARARFPAASTLKVAIAVEVLRTLSGKPRPGGTVDRLLRAMLIRSDNAAANALEVLLAGSTSAGGGRVTALMEALGMTDSLMYGGYARAPQGRRPIPLRAEEQPAMGRGKYTTARDLARLFALLHLASAGRGPLARRFGSDLTPSDARYLLYLLAHVADAGKLDRLIRPLAAVLHKGGWLAHARHAGLVYWRGGVFVVAVMTHGAGVERHSDALAGNVALAALRFFRG